MWFLRLAKSRHKLFRTQFLFGTKIKSTYKSILWNTKILDLSVKRGSQRPFQVPSKAKMSRFAPNIFWTLYQFSGSLSLTIEYSKKIVVPFFRFGKIWPIFTLDMVKNWNFEIFHKTKNDYFIKINDSCFIVKVKIFDFWPCLKTKWAISCWNGKTGRQFFLNIQ